MNSKLSLLFQDNYSTTNTRWNTSGSFDFYALSLPWIITKQSVAILLSIQYAVSLATGLHWTSTNRGIIYISNFRWCMCVFHAIYKTSIWKYILGYYISYNSVNMYVCMACPGQFKCVYSEMYKWHPESLKRNWHQALRHLFALHSVWTNAMLYSLGTTILKAKSV